MNATLLHAVVRVADARTPDADLLARFVRAQDSLAFEELVRRHGPLVWAVCRQLLPHHADAEDAFQAVFLALVRGAGAIRAGQALPAWLHGVAVRAATKAKRTAARRRQREAKAAVPEADRPVPDASWGRLMAAVHEEVQRLPDAERIAFVLCELEGVRQPDAAARLGWPLGTLSGRLSKARQRLLDQLTRRGIAPAMLVVGGLAGSAGSVPAALVLKANSIPTAVGIPSTVAELARGLVGGVTMRTKLLAATVLVAGAIGVGGGALVLTHAGAQDPDVIKETKELLGGLAGADGGDGQPPRGGGAKQPGKGGPKDTPGGLPGGPGAGVGGLPGQNVPGVMGMPGMGGMGMTAGMGVAHTQWDYKFVDVVEERGAFEKAITTAGNDGWEFASSERLRRATGEDLERGQLVLVFKRPKGGAAMGGMMGGGGFGRGGGRGGEFGGEGAGGGLRSGGGRGGPGAPGGEGGGRGGDRRSSGPGEGYGSPGPGGRGPGAGGPGEGSGGPPMPGSAPGVGPGAMPGPGGFPGGPGGRPTPGGPMGRPGAPGGPGGSPGGEGGYGGMPGMPGGSSPRASGLTVLTLKHATANEMASVLEQVFGSKASITVDGRTNQIIVRADADTLKELQTLLEKLDVQVPPKR